MAAEPEKLGLGVAHGETSRVRGGEPVGKDGRADLADTDDSAKALSVAKLKEFRGPKGGLRK